MKNKNGGLDFGRKTFIIIIIVCLYEHRRTMIFILLSQSREEYSKMDHIIIEGFMGSGKGSISKRVAQELSLPVIDVDRKISDRMKMTPAEIYDHFGDVYYRAMETFILTELKKTKERSIIIIGSGLPTVPQSAAILKELGTVYYLKTDMSMIISRLDRGKKSDWLEENADLRERVKKLLEEREPFYLKAADVVIEAKKRTVADIVEELVGIIRSRSGEPAAEAGAEAAAKEAKPGTAGEAETEAAAEEAKPEVATEVEAEAEAEVAKAEAAAEEAKPEAAAEAEKAEAAPAESAEEAEKKPKKKSTAKKTAAKKPAAKKTAAKKTAAKKAAKAEDSAESGPDGEETAV